MPDGHSATFDSLRGFARAARCFPLRARSVEEWISLARVGLLFTLIPALSLGIIELPEASARAVVVVLAGYVILLALAAGRVGVLARTDLIIALDLLVVTLVVAVSGGTDSPFVYLYYLTILEAAARLSIRQALAASTAVAGIIVLLWVASGRAELLETAGFRTGAFIASGFFLALLLGVLTEECRAARQRVAELRRETQLAARLSGKLWLRGVVEILLDAFLETAGAAAGAAYLVGDEGAVELGAARGEVWPGGDHAAARRLLAGLPAAAAAGNGGAPPSPAGPAAPDALLWLPVPYAGRTRLLLGAARSAAAASDAVRRRLSGIVALGGPALEAARLHEEVERLAATDSLTGLANRRAFLDRFHAELARARRAGRPLAVALIDLNGFKHINDTCGHPAGDAVLARVAAALSAALRVSDLAARFGGDEFAVLLPDADVPGAEAVLARVPAIDCDLAAAAGRPLRVSYAWGAAACPDDGSSPEQLLQHADARLYAMKRAEGRASG
jgi:diguanylate cyclase (GGDEF)-like protein